MGAIVERRRQETPRLFWLEKPVWSEPSHKQRHEYVWDPCWEELRGLPEAAASAKFDLLRTCACHPALIRSDTDLTVRVATCLQDLQSQRVNLPGAEEVRAYLLRHSDLADVLVSVAEAARRRLGADTQLSLELYRDPEVADAYLTMYVRKRVYGADMLEQLDGLREDYESDLTGKSGWFLLTTDFRQPA